MNYNDFAETIKQKHPEYKNVDNFTLAKKIIEKHPEYKGKVELLSPQEAKKYGVKPEYITPEYKAQIDKLEADKNTKVNKARVGAGLMIASPLITAFTGGLGLPATLGLMATEGGVYGLGEGLLKDDLSAKNIAKNAALGAGIGGVTAGAMKGVKAYKASRIAKVAKKADQVIEETPKITPKQKISPEQITANKKPAITQQKNKPVAVKKEAPPTIPPKKPPVATMIGDEIPEVGKTEIIIREASGAGGNIPPKKPPTKVAEVEGLPMETGNTIPEEYIFEGQKTGQKIRKTYKSLDASKFGDDPEFMANIEPEKMYDTVTNTDTFAQAMNLSSTEADAIIKSADPSALRTMTNIKRLGDALDAEDQLAAQELGNHLLRRGTDMGQAIQAYSLIKKLSPEGAVLAMLNVNRGATPKLAQNLIDNADDIVNGVNNARKEAINVLTNINDIAGKSSSNIKVANPEDAWNFVVDELGKKLARKVNTHVVPEIEQTISPAEQVIKTLYSVAKEELPKRGKKAPADLFMFVRNALQNKPLYGETYNKAQQIIANKYAKDPEKLQILNKYLTELKDNPYSQDYVNKITSDLMKGQNVKIKDLIKAHVSKEDFTAQNLKNDLMQKLGIDEQTASKFSLETQKRFYGQLNEARTKALDQYFKDVPPLKRKDLHQKIIELDNMGALDSAKYIDEISKKFKTPNLTTEDITQAKNLAEKIQTTTGRDNEIAVGQLRALISSKKPVSLGRKISTVQSMAQLMNPKTITRNILGNTMYQGLENITQVPATLIDKGVSKLTGQRSITLPNLKTQLVEGAKGAGKAIEDIKIGIDTTGNDKFDLFPVNTFKNPVMNTLEKAMSSSLRVPDRFAFEGAKADILEGFKKLGNEITPELEQYAEELARKKTFQDDSALAKGFQGAKNLANFGQDWGVGDIFLKYARTPANLISRGLSYSPVGLAKGFGELGSLLKTGQVGDLIGIAAQNKAVGDVSRGLVGSGIVGGGYLAAKNGLTNGSMVDNDFRGTMDLQANQKLTGNQPYSLKFGDKSYTFDWAQPTALPFSAGVNMANNDGLGLIGSIAGGVNTVTEQPLFQGIQDLVSNLNTEQDKGKAVMKTIAGVPASFTPGLLNQVNQLMDNNIRETYDPNVWMQGLNKAKARIPGLAQTLPIRPDVTGQPMQRYQNGSNNLFNVMFNPGFSRSNSGNPAVNSMLDIYNKTGETSQLFPTVKKTLKINGENKQLTPEEYVNYQKLTGQANNQFINDLINSDQYQYMDDADRINTINGIQTNVNEAVMSRLFETPGLLDKKPMTAKDIIKRKLSPVLRIQNLMQKSDINNFVNTK